METLSEIGYRHKTDKCPAIKHHFTEFYDDLFRLDRLQVRKVVEIGIGCMAPHFVKGASLYMWREYFPNAMIYGADIDPTLLFSDNRIKTYFCDQGVPDDLRRLVAQTGPDVDLFIDDGLHTPESQVNTCKIVMPLLNRGTLYSIEDVGHREIVEQLAEYDCQIVRKSHPRYRDDCLVLVRHR